MTERIRVAELRGIYLSLDETPGCPLSGRELAALVEVVVAAKAVAREPSGHQLGGEHPLYVVLCTLDEALDRFDFGEA